MVYITSIETSRRIGTSTNGAAMFSTGYIKMSDGGAIIINPTTGRAFAVPIGRSRFILVGESIPFPIPEQSLLDMIANYETTCRTLEE